MVIRRGDVDAVRDGSPLSTHDAPEESVYSSSGHCRSDRASQTGMRKNSICTTAKQRKFANAKDSYYQQEFLKYRRYLPFL